MLREHLPFVLVLSVVAVLPQARASNIKRQPQRFAPVSLPYIWNTDAVVGNGPFAMPSSPDNWLGGTGNWSNGADWSAGLPGGSSDVTIDTGNDTVTLDTSASINSLTLGGSSGSSQLTGDGNAHLLTIAGALTVNQSGNLYLSANSVSTGLDFTNQGTTSIEYGSGLQVSGNVNNSGTLNLGNNLVSNGNSLTIADTLTNSGAISIGSESFMSGNGAVTVGAFNNIGVVTLDGPSTVFQVSGNAMNSGSITLLSNSSFTVTGTLTNSGTLQTAIGLTSVTQAISIGTLMNTSTGSFLLAPTESSANIGTLINQGQIGLDGSHDFGGSSLQVAGNATNSGTIRLAGDGGPVTMQVGGTLMNNPGAQLTMDADGDRVSAGNLVNLGGISLQSGNGDMLMISGSLQNTGSISAQSSATIQAASLTNSGSVQITNNSALRILGDVNNSGTILTGNFGGMDTFNITGKLTNAASGTFSLSANGDLANIGYVSNAGTLFLGTSTSLNVTGGARAAVTALPGFLNSGIVDISSGSTLSDALTYTQTAGQTTVDGTLRVSARGVVNFAGGEVYGNLGTIQGSITNNAAINIGDGPQLVGAMTFMGNYTQGPNGSLTFDIAGPATGQYDQLNISGHAQLNGLMTVDLLHGYIPQIGNTFDIMNFASESGTFSMVVGLPINNQEHFTLQYNSTNLTLDVVSGQSQGASGSNVGSEPFITSAEPDSAPYSLTASNQATLDSTPEPGSLLLFGSGVIGLGLRLYRTR